MGTHTRVCGGCCQSAGATLQQAELLAYQRRLGHLRCADVMSPAVHRVEFGTPLQEAWDLLRRHRIKALPGWKHPYELMPGYPLTA